ncbi:NADP-dependent oxidoreductase domain-containing protein [Hyaloraphidium curvatum]|nr:NADP-dependent oxidoreductase domain-containing protein [Hyaloraphidium curvatum]
MSDTPKMEYRRLGDAGIRVSALSLGGWVTYGKQVGQDATSACMKTAFAFGANFFDTAEVYAAGKSEIEMGKAVKELGAARQDLVIATKIYWGSGSGVNSQGLSKKHIIEGTTASLERLGLDYVDLLFAHRPDDTVPMREIVRAFNHVLDKGQALYWGTSEWRTDQLLEAHRVAEKLGLEGPQMEQPEYNMFNRQKMEVDYLPLFKNFGMGTTIWSPLASGVLTGKYLSGVPADSRFGANKDPFMVGLAQRVLESDTAKKRMSIVENLKPVADSLGCTMAQMALAWTLKNPNVSTCITGASKPEQVTENMKALNVVPKLTDDVMKQLDEILGTKPTPPQAHFRN